MNSIYNITTTYAGLAAALQALTAETEITISDPENAVFGDITTEGTLGYILYNNSNTSNKYYIIGDFTGNTNVTDCGDYSGYFGHPGDQAAQEDDYGCQYLEGISSMPASITNMKYAFMCCASLNNYDFLEKMVNVKCLDYCFSQCKSISGTFTLPNTLVNLESVVSMLASTKGITRLEVDGSFPKLTDISFIAYGSEVETAKISAPAATNAVSIFSYDSKLTSVDLSGCTSITSISEAFYMCSSLGDDIKFDQSIKLKTMSEAFRDTAVTNTSFLPRDLSGIDDARSMFRECKSLTSATLYNFAYSYNAEHVFTDCTALTDAYLDGCGIRNLNGMFEGCTSLKKLSIKNMQDLTTLSTLDMPYGNLNELHVINCPKLATIGNTYNGNTSTYRLTAIILLDMENLPLLATEPIFTMVGASTTLKAVNISNCPLITSISCSSENALISASLSGMNGLTSIRFNNCSSIAYFDISGCPALTSLSLGVCKKLKSLNVGSVLPSQITSHSGCFSSTVLDTITAASSTVKAAWDSELSTNYAAWGLSAAIASIVPTLTFWRRISSSDTAGTPGKLAAFTDTDGTASGTQGLVPAPSASQKNYLLSTSGWKTLDDVTVAKASTFPFSTVENTSVTVGSASSYALYLTKLDLSQKFAWRTTSKFRVNLSQGTMNSTDRICIYRIAYDSTAKAYSMALAAYSAYCPSSTNTDYTVVDATMEYNSGILDPANDYYIGVFTNNANNLRFYGKNSSSLTFGSVKPCPSVYVDNITAVDSNSKPIPPTTFTPQNGSALMFAQIIY